MHAQHIIIFIMMWKWSANNVCAMCVFTCTDRTQQRSVQKLASLGWMRIDDAVPWFFRNTPLHNSRFAAWYVMCANFTKPLTISRNICMYTHVNHRRRNRRSNWPRNIKHAFNITFHIAYCIMLSINIDIVFRTLNERRLCPSTCLSISICECANFGFIFQTFTLYPTLKRVSERRRWLNGCPAKPDRLDLNR